MIEIYNPWMFRIERHDTGCGDVFYSFYAEHSANMKVASKYAICSIFCTSGDASDLILKEIQSRVRDCRLALNQTSEESIQNREMFEQLQDFVQKNFNGCLIQMEPYENFPERTRAVEFLSSIGSENPRHEIGEVQFCISETSSSKLSPLTIIAAIPIQGIITQIPRCSQYTLHAGKLAVLSDTDVIKKKYPDMTKVVYIIGEIYDDLQINEYLIINDCGYRIRHVFNSYEIDNIDEKYFSKIDKMSNSIESLFQVNGSVNLFPLGRIPKGIWRKNNELMTRL